MTPYHPLATTRTRRFAAAGALLLALGLVLETGAIESTTAGYATDVEAAPAEALPVLWQAPGVRLSSAPSCIAPGRHADEALAVVASALYSISLTDGAVRRLGARAVHCVGQASHGGIHHAAVPDGSSGVPFSTRQVELTFDSHGEPVFGSYSAGQALSGASLVRADPDQDDWQFAGVGNDLRKVQFGSRNPSLGSARVVNSDITLSSKVNDVRSFRIGWLVAAPGEEKHDFIVKPMDVSGGIPFPLRQILVRVVPAFALAERSDGLIFAVELLDGAPVLTVYADGVETGSPVPLAVTPTSLVFDEVRGTLFGTTDDGRIVEIDPGDGTTLIEIPFHDGAGFHGTTPSGTHLFSTGAAVRWLAD